MAEISEKIFSSDTKISNYKNYELVKDSF
jgi:hypothetical protein